MGSTVLLQSLILLHIEDDIWAFLATFLKQRTYIIKIIMYMLSVKQHIRLIELMQYSLVSAPLTRWNNLLDSEDERNKTGNYMDKGKIKTAGYTAVGSTAGAGVSYTILTFLGINGLSAAGITSGLAAAGALVGGGMVAGVGIMALPVLGCGIAGYYLAHRKTAKVDHWCPK